MKIDKIIKGVVLCGAMVLSLTGCKSEYEPDYQRVYFEQAATASFKKVAVEPGELVKVPLTVRLVKPQSVPTVVKIDVDPSLITTYNTKYGAGFEALDRAIYSFEKEVVFDPGKTQASVTVEIQPFESTGASVAIPIRISSVDGPVEPSVNSSKLLLLLDQPIVQFVPEMVSASNPRAAACSDDLLNWNETVNNWSLEAWVWMSGFQINNQAIFNFKATTEIYIRFGDAPIDFRSLQIKYLGTQNNTTHLFAANTWNHITFTYTGASGDLTVYVNGKADFTVSTNGGPITINAMEMVSSGDWFRDKCRMAQVRLWKKALSETEINSNMLSLVKVDDPNLMGYWKLDEGEGRVFKNCATAPKDNRDLTAKADMPWIANTRFDGK